MSSVIRQRLTLTSFKNKMKIIWGLIESPFATQDLRKSIASLASSLAGGVWLVHSSELLQIKSSVCVRLEGRQQWVLN